MIGRCHGVQLPADNDRSKRTLKQIIVLYREIKNVLAFYNGRNEGKDKMMIKDYIVSWSIDVVAHLTPFTTRMLNTERRTVGTCAKWYYHTREFLKEMPNIFTIRHIPLKRHQCNMRCISISLTILICVASILLLLFIFLNTDPFFMKQNF